MAVACRSWPQPGTVGERERVNAEKSLSFPPGTFSASRPGGAWPMGLVQKVLPAYVFDVRLQSGSGGERTDADEVVFVVAHLGEEVAETIEPAKLS